MGILKKIIVNIVGISIILCCSLIKYGYDIYRSALNEMPIQEKVQEIKSIENYTEYNELPEDYINAVIAVEDKRFWKHSGVDALSILRAVFVDISKLSLKEGGSTITQQLAKNTYFTQEKKITRKIAEMFMAVKFEQNLSKEEIFELYVNTSYFGDGYYCVKDAALGYFDKLPQEMDLYECTLLAGIPNAPSVYAPTKNPELARQRQGQVIRKMISQGYLTDEEAAKIILVSE